MHRCAVVNENGFLAGKNENEWNATEIHKILH